MSQPGHHYISQDTHAIMEDFSEGNITGLAEAEASAIKKEVG